MSKPGSGSFSPNINFTDCSLSHQLKNPEQPPEKHRRKRCWGLELIRKDRKKEKKKIQSSNLEMVMFVMRDRAESSQSRTSNRRGRRKEDLELRDAWVAQKKTDLELIMTEMDVSTSSTELEECICKAVEALMALTT
uniref:Uncharacterized protein n=1 Tax=Canis lupus familiaris TaxID=9615 RepID=A0A8P0PKZ7_CANLF